MGKRFCPKCKSESIAADVDNAVLGIPINYKCNDCGYSGNIFPEKEKIKIKK